MPSVSSSSSCASEPKTDLWQRSYYGFRKDDAPALLIDTDQNFTFTTKVRFNYKALFDQCGLLIYLDSDNWFKASIEYENETFSRLGSVVTNLGYSDWATTEDKTVRYYTPFVTFTYDNCHALLLHREPD